MALTKPAHQFKNFGISKPEILAYINVYPNPVSNTINFQLGTDAKKFKAFIYNWLG